MCQAAPPVGSLSAGEARSGRALRTMLRPVCQSGDPRQSPPTTWTSETLYALDADVVKELLRPVLVVTGMIGWFLNRSPRPVLAFRKGLGRVPANAGKLRYVLSFARQSYADEALRRRPSAPGIG